MRRRELVRHLETVRHVLLMAREDALRYRVGIEVDEAVHAITDAIARLKRAWDPYDPADRKEG